MSDSIDKEIISPMARNRTRLLISSDTEKEIVINNLKKNRKRNRIVQQYPSSEEKVPNINIGKIDARYKQKVRKIQRNSGKSYCTNTGKIVPEKIFENKDCGCRNACMKNYNEAERRAIFENFWGLADFNKQNVFLHEAVQHRIIKRRRPANGKGSPRNFSFRYLLHSRNGKISVCKKFFLDTFKVSEGRLKRVLYSTNVGNDMRGRMLGSSRQVSEEAKKHVQEHIESFPIFESDHTRSHNPNRNYLHPDLSIRKMFNLYELHCEENGLKAVSEWTYRKIFKNYFNLNLHQPRKDTSQICDLINVKVEESNNDEKNEDTEEHKDTL